MDKHGEYGEKTKAKPYRIKAPSHFQVDNGANKMEQASLRETLKIESGGH